MKKSPLLIIFFIIRFTVLYAQADTISSYTKKTYLIPMRDGIKLFTVVLTPTQPTKPLPFLIQRTPYGADFPLPEDSTLPVNAMGSFQPMAKEGYIAVFQDIRGKFKSEGTFEMTRPLYHLLDKTKTDESTDAYDAIDWLVKNIKNNNGKAGINGVSYRTWRRSPDLCPVVTDHRIVKVFATLPPFV